MAIDMVLSDRSVFHSISRHWYSNTLGEEGYSVLAKEIRNRMIELTDVELFKDLTFIEEGGENYDLHNEFECFSFMYDQESETVNMAFKERNSKSLESDKICIMFKGVSFCKFELSLIRSEDSATINNFYRGRFEMDGKLYEKSSEGASYFYIEFETGDKFEFFAKKAMLVEI
ncbi:MAG: hypothetical protein Q8938_15265 [Bacteroidota bacterium]|nr:hypothetical protein [Bacteroidota bacterium]MDP4260056.1 hypothetical protein [Bacteroidota bacterium]